MMLSAYVSIRLVKGDWDVPEDAQFRVSESEREGTPGPYACGEERGRRHLQCAGVRRWSGAAFKGSRV